MKLQKIHKINIYDNLINQIKAKTVFLDESFVVSSRVRKSTQLTNTSVTKVADAVCGEGVYQSLLNNKRILRRKMGRRVHLWNLPSNHELSLLDSKILKIKREVNLLTKTFKYVHPLSPKFIVGFHSNIKDELSQLYSFKQKLTDEVPKHIRSPIMQIKGGALVPYRPGNIIEQHEIGITLKPYYSKITMSYLDVQEELNKQKQKCLKSLATAKKANQNKRCRGISLRLNDIQQFSYLIESLGKRFELVGQKLSGVKTWLSLNECLLEWPDCLVGSITKTDGYYRDNIGKHSVVNRFEVQTQLDLKIPVVAFGRIHVFTTNLLDTKTILNTITSHQLNKFRPFSLYKQKLNSNYPLHNSIWWPELEDGANYGESS